MSDNKTKRENEHDTLMRVIFGDEETGEVGMKKKLDDIHKVMVQLDGVGSFVKWIVTIAAALTAIKLWLMK